MTATDTDNEPCWSFRGWLIGQRDRLDAVGDFARDLRDGRCLGHRLTPHAIAAHLHADHAPSDAAMQSLIVASDEWYAQGRPETVRNDWQLPSRAPTPRGFVWSLDRGYTSELDAVSARDRAVTSGATETYIVAKRLSAATTGWGVWSLTRVDAETLP